MYENFLYRLMDANICEAVRDYPQFIRKENAFEYADCVRLNGGILKRGFLISTKNLMATFSEILSIVQSDPTLHIQKLREWQRRVSITDFNQFNTIIR